MLPRSDVISIASYQLLDIPAGNRQKEDRGARSFMWLGRRPGVKIQAGHKIAIINSTFATRYFGDTNPVGRQVRLPRLGSLPAPTDLTS